MQEKFVPLSNKVTIRPLPKDPIKEGAIIVVGEDNAPVKGVVVEVGRGVPIINDEGAWAIVPLELKSGMVVLYPPHIGVEVESNGEKLLLVAEEQVLGIVS